MKTIAAALALTTVVLAAPAGATGSPGTVEPTMRLSGPTTVVEGGAPLVTVRLRHLEGHTAKGWIRISEQGKVLRKVRLAEVHDGTRHVKVPGLGLGRHRLTVEYTGRGDVAGVSQERLVRVTSAE